MEIKYNIRQLDRNTSDGGVTTAHWNVVATEDKYSATAYGSVSFMPDPLNESFIPFENLTEEIVVQWIKNKLGEEYITSLEQNLTKQIEDQKAPKVVSGLPW